MYRLLIPFKFDDEPLEALSFARKLKESLDCKITVLGFTDGTVPLHEQQKLIEVQEKQITRFHPYIDKLITAKPEVDLVESISEHCRDNDIEVLILGGNPIKNPDNFVHQDHLELIFREVPCPVMFVPGPIDPDQMKGITFYIPKKLQEKKENILFFKDIANALHSKIHLLSVLTPSVKENSLILEELRNIADKFMFPEYSINTTYNTNIPDGIDYFKNKKRTPMVVIASGGQNHDFKPRLVENLLKRVSNTVICIL